MERTKEYATFTITHVGENDHGRVYAVFSKYLKGVFADIRKREKESEYELCLYEHVGISVYFMKRVVEFIEAINKEREDAN